MLCSASRDALHREGCNISVTLSAGADFPSLSQENVSPKNPGFFSNLMRKSTSNKKEKGDKSPSWSLFSKKEQTSPTSTPASVAEQSQADKATAELIEQLLQEGRDEAEINFHLSFIHDSSTLIPAPQPVAASPQPQPEPKESTNIFSRLIRDIQTAFKEEEYYVPYPYPEYEDDLHTLTVGISSAPFYGAMPPDTDMSYEELASIEPVYVGNQCINNLPCCVHDGSPLPGDQTTCPVCLDELVEGESMKSLPCVHFFHKDCIDSWLMVGHTCPVCKLLIE